MDTDDIGKGCVVCSLAGRDKGNMFFVLDRDGDYVLLVDGRLRRIENPKRKKIRHLRFVARREDIKLYAKITDGIKPDNAEIRKTMKLFTDLADEGS